MKLPTVRETLNLQSVPTLDNLEKRVPNDLLRIDIPESGPINPVAAMHRAVYYSLMAPSGHNVQPWKVYIDETNLKIVLCLNKKRIPPFFLAVDSLSFYDRTSAAGSRTHNQTTVARVRIPSDATSSREQCQSRLGAVHAHFYRTSWCRNSQTSIDEATTELGCIE
jgi:hypothetical protein